MIMETTEALQAAIRNGNAIRNGAFAAALLGGFESGKRENRKRRQRALEPLGQEAANPVKSRGHGRRGSRRRRHEAKAWQVEKTGDRRGAPMHNRQSARVGKRSRIAPTIPRELATLKSLTVIVKSLLPLSFFCFDSSARS